MGVEPLVPPALLHFSPGGDLAASTPGIDQQGIASISQCGRASPAGTGRCLCLLGRCLALMSSLKLRACRDHRASTHRFPASSRVDCRRRLRYLLWRARTTLHPADCWTASHRAPTPTSTSAEAHGRKHGMPLALQAEGAGHDANLRSPALQLASNSPCEIAEGYLPKR